MHRNRNFLLHFYWLIIRQTSRILSWVPFGRKMLTTTVLERVSQFVEISRFYSGHLSSREQPKIAQLPFDHWSTATLEFSATVQYGNLLWFLRVPNSHFFWSEILYLFHILGIFDQKSVDETFCHGAGVAEILIIKFIFGGQDVQQSLIIVVTLEWRQTTYSEEDRRHSRFHTHFLVRHTDKDFPGVLSRRQTQQIQDLDQFPSD